MKYWESILITHLDKVSTKTKLILFMKTFCPIKFVKKMTGHLLSFIPSIKDSQSSPLSFVNRMVRVIMLPRTWQPCNTGKTNGIRIKLSMLLMEGSAIILNNSSSLYKNGTPQKREKVHLLNMSGSGLF